LQLTTPELREYDTVFPGENWFFYWRTSPSLWETKLREYQGPNPIFIPIYWGLHSENLDQYDFGNYRPETDIARLFKIAKALGKDLSIVIPTTPAPFLANGGLPSYIAKSINISDDGLAMAVVDNDGRLNKLFSFYDPRVFQAYRKFVWHFGQYITQAGISCEVFGGDFGYISDDVFRSYFEDKSLAFEQGFHRYLKQLEDGNPNEIETLKNNHSYELELKKRYSLLISDLYVQAVAESLPGNWGGKVSFSFLGGAPEDIFARSSDLWEHSGDFFKPLMDTMVNNIIPCSALLSAPMKQGPLIKALKDIVTTGYIHGHTDHGLYDDEIQMSFNPLIHFEIYYSAADKLKKDNILVKSALGYFLDREYKYSHRIHFKTFEYEAEYEHIERVHFFYGNDIKLEDFNQLIKLFLNGGRVFIDVANVDPEIEKKLNLFLMENNINTEKINFLTPIVKAQLGEGIILTYDSIKLMESSLIKRVGFWETMVKFLEIRHLKIQSDEDVYFLWKSRSSNTYELDYEEIRRVSFYNPTSYKKKANVLSSKNFAFLKTIDETNVEVKSTPIGIDIVLLPGGSVSLDFGYYE